VALLGLELHQCSATPQHGHREGAAGKREERSPGGTAMQLQSICYSFYVVTCFLYM